MTFSPGLREPDFAVGARRRLANWADLLNLAMTPTWAPGDESYVDGTAAKVTGARAFSPDSLEGNALVDARWSTCVTELHHSILDVELGLPGIMLNSRSEPLDDLKPAIT